MSRRLEKLEQDIRQSRERLSATLDELRGRIQPSNLRQEGSEYLANTAPAEFVANLKADVLGNPMPLAMLGLAVAWLAASSRKTDRSAPTAGYADVAHWARRLALAAQQNASKAARTVQATGSAAHELRQRATDASKNMADQLGRAPGQVRDFGQTFAKSTATRANAVGDVARSHPLFAGAAAAGIAASAVALTFLYRRYAGELDGASNLVRASQQEADRQRRLTMVAAEVEEAHATLVPQSASGLPENDPLTSVPQEESRAGFIE